jgi:hypothetical protein
MAHVSRECKPSQIKKIEFLAQSLKAETLSFKKEEGMTTHELSRA